MVADGSDCRHDYCRWPAHILGYPREAAGITRGAREIDARTKARVEMNEALDPIVGACQWHEHARPAGTRALDGREDGGRD